ncbi:MAG: hypothetical protein DRI86_05670, partial [Bacteroidetes bacterium]
MTQKEIKQYYTYIIFDPISLKRYVGYRGTFLTPAEDLGQIYFSSTTNEELKDILTKPNNLEYIVLDIFRDEKEAAKAEKEILSRNAAAKNPLFWNLSNGIGTPIFNPIGSKWVTK